MYKSKKFKNQCHKYVNWILEYLGFTTLFLHISTAQWHSPKMKRKLPCEGQTSKSWAESRRICSKPSITLWRASSFFKVCCVFSSFVFLSVVEWTASGGSPGWTAGPVLVKGIAGGTLIVVWGLFIGGWELRGNATLLLRSSPRFGVFDCAVPATAS